jgi:hypothetical protein
MTARRIPPAWASRAKVGDKIVCVMRISPRNYLRELHPNPPKFGNLYTITNIKVTNTGSIYFALAECGGSPAHFYARGFRPVQTKSTEAGMSILRALLNTKQLVE